MWIHAPYTLIFLATKNKTDLDSVGHSEIATNGAERAGHGPSFDSTLHLKLYAL